MRADGQLPKRRQDEALWQRSRETEMAEDEADRLLDLAGYADGVLDAEDSARIAELLASDLAAASDVTAARAFGAAPTPEVPEAVFARALALVQSSEAARGRVILFPARSWTRPKLRFVAQWGSLAAAVVMAGWLGFALGADASMSLTRAAPQSEDGFFRELLEPSAGFLRGLTDGAQT